MRLPSIGLCAQTACIWEVMAKKPGNVHRDRDFDDLTFDDFVLSAIAIAPHMESARGRGVGETILESVRATKKVCRTNSNLGIILLIAPLSSVPEDGNLRSGVEEILASLTIRDAELTYQAIREAQPGGLGESTEQDVNEAPTQTLREVMTLAADRDMIARQYANGFEQIFDEALPVLEETLQNATVEQAVLKCYLRLLARHPDSLIARKLGREQAQEVSRRAARVQPDSLEEFDNWLRKEGHSRNPGTTADLIAGCLFVALRTGVLRCDHSFH